MTAPTHIPDWRRDIPAALVVLIVAIPFCLGIALASGAPLSAGLITGVVGGILVGALSGSSLMVSGPAAGLTAMVLTGITGLGSFQSFLVAVVLAGVLQIVFGVLRIGIVGMYFPSAVVRGMMAAIGIILMLKQLPHAVGYDVGFEGDVAFQQGNRENTFSALSQMFDGMHAGALVVMVVVIVVLVVWHRIRPGRLHFVTGAVVTVCIGVTLNAVFPFVHSALPLETTHLVQLPATVSVSDWLAHFRWPDWSALGTAATWRLAFTLAAFASLETLLSLDATDKLDPHKRESNPNRELFAQGIGNIVCGLLGGLPVAGVIVRSATNVDAGAHTRRATMMQGACILIAVMAFPMLLNHIPLSALAAILLFVGYRLAAPSVFQQMWSQGQAQFVPFMVTVLAMVFTDLLVGILIGLAVGLFFILVEHLRQPALRTISPPGAVLTRYALPDQATFLNKANIARTLNAVPSGSRVEIDGRQTSRFDFDVLELLYEFRDTAKLRNIDYRLVGIPVSHASTTIAH